MSTDPLNTSEHSLKITRSVIVIRNLGHILESPGKLKSLMPESSIPRNSELWDEWGLEFLKTSQVILMCSPS